jgi:hypothetical protein
VGAGGPDVSSAVPEIVAEAFYLQMRTAMTRTDRLTDGLPGALVESQP